jgi:hypothetical protein
MASNPDAEPTYEDDFEDDSKKPATSTASSAPATAGGGGSVTASVSASTTALPTTSATTGGSVNASLELSTTANPGVAVNASTSSLALTDSQKRIAHAILDATDSKHTTAASQQPSNTSTAATPAADQPQLHHYRVSIDLRSVRGLPQRYEGVVLRYLYPLFGSSSPVITQPPIPVCHERLKHINAVSRNECDVYVCVCVRAGARSQRSASKRVCSVRVYRQRTAAGGRRGQSTAHCAADC